MSLLHRVRLRVNRHRVLNGIASDVAERSFAAAWDKIRFKAGTMTSSECHGYARAHAAAEVHRVLGNTVRRHHLPELWHDRLAELATELLVERIEVRLQSTASHSEPLRRAA